MRSLASFVLLSALFVGSASALSHSQPRGFEVRPRHMAMGRGSVGQVAKRAQPSSGCDDQDDDQDDDDDDGNNVTRASSQPSNSSNSGGSGGGGGGSTSGLPGGLQGTLYGDATFFYQGGVAGSCGTVHSDSDKIIAVQKDLMDPYQSILCGKTVTVKNLETGATTTATIADTCPGCSSSTSIDLSTGTFNALGSQSQGVLKISWVISG